MSTPSRWRAWWLAARPATLTASIAPVLAGSALARAEGAFRAEVLALALVGAALIQIGTNLANDYFDFARGADGADRLGPARATAQGWIAPRQVLAACALAFAAAALAGLRLVAIGGWPIAALGLASIAAGIGYTAGRYALAYLGLGELFVFLFFGLAAVVATAHLHGARLGPGPALAGVALGALASAILVVNNLRDRDSDARADKRTLAVRLGAEWSRREYALLIAAPYAAATVGALTVGRAGWLLPWLSAPLALALVRGVYRADGRALNPWLGRTAGLELCWAVLLAVGVTWA